MAPTEFYFSRRSQEQLDTCDVKIKRVFGGIIEVRDCKILEGIRGRSRQIELFISKKSKLDWPNSKHNRVPSQAVDVVPWPFPQEAWEDREFWVEWTSWVKGFATGMGVTLISGFDWDNDYDLRDQKFYDGPHFELVEIGG
ncbi:MAG: M15 family peptidase [Acidobacteriota bacterium]